MAQAQTTPRPRSPETGVFRRYLERHASAVDSEVTLKQLEDLFVECVRDGEGDQSCATLEIYLDRFCSWHGQDADTEDLTSLYERIRINVASAFTAPEAHEALLRRIAARWRPRVDNGFDEPRYAFGYLNALYAEKYCRTELRKILDGIITSVAEHMSGDDIARWAKESDCHDGIVTRLMLQRAHAAPPDALRADAVRTNTLPSLTEPVREDIGDAMRKTTSFLTRIDRALRWAEEQYAPRFRFEKAENQVIWLTVLGSPTGKEPGNAIVWSAIHVGFMNHDFEGWRVRYAIGRSVLEADELEIHDVELHAVPF